MTDLWVITAWEWLNPQTNTINKVDRIIGLCVLTELPYIPKMNKQVYGAL